MSVNTDLHFEDDDEIYYSDDEQRDSPKDEMITKSDDQLVYGFDQSLLKTGLRRPNPIITCIDTNPMTVDEEETNCCSVNKNLVKVDSDLDSIALKAYEELDKHLNKAIDSLQSEERMSANEWMIRFESNFIESVFDVPDISVDRIRQISTTSGALFDSIRDSTNECEIGGKPLTQDMSTQTDISGLIVMEDIYHDY